MCDFERISVEKNELMRDIDSALQLSGSRIILIEEHMEQLSKRADENMKKLSFLL